MISPGIIKVSHSGQPHAVDHLLPFSDSRVQITQHDDCLSIVTTVDDDTLRLHDSASGVLMQIGEYVYEFSLQAHEVLSISTGDGNDTVRIESGLSNRVIIDTGAGNDNISIHGTTSTVLSGAGDDDVHITEASAWVDAGPGNDRVLVTGHRQAIIHGGEGDDFIYSAAHHNFLQAGEGNDTLIIGAGRGDIEALSGDNIIVAGPDKDVFFVDTDRSEIIGANENDDVHTDQLPLDRAGFVALPDAQKHQPHLHVMQGSSTVGDRALSLEGSADFKRRVQDDLRLLKASATAYPLLKALDDSGASILIKEESFPDNAVFVPDLSAGDPHINNGQPGTPVKSATILYNPLATRPDTPAVVILYHELCHAWNNVYGTVLQDHELQVVGLATNESPFDFDNDPLTPPTNTNPAPFNENALRQELGLPLRLSYP